MFLNSGRDQQPPPPMSSAQKVLNQSYSIASSSKRSAAKLTALKDIERQQKISQTLSQTKQSDELSIRARMNNTKHFTESARLQEVNQLYSTLEEHPIGEDDDNEEAELDNEIAADLRKYQAASAISGSR
jgi:transcriptional regulator of acetoin/glycerol metabolism